MAIKGNFSYDGVPELSENVLKKLVREALTLALQEWRQKMEPQHFTNSATAAYRYQKRNKGYQIKKATRTGQTAPLVYSGKSKSMALGSNKITGRGSQVTLSISVPDYWQYVKTQNPDMAKELTTVTSAEQAQLVVAMEKHLQRLVDARLKK